MDPCVIVASPACVWSPFLRWPRVGGGGVVSFKTLDGWGGVRPALGGFITHGSTNKENQLREGGTGRPGPCFMNFVDPDMQAEEEKQGRQKEGNKAEEKKQGRE